MDQIRETRLPESFADTDFDSVTLGNPPTDDIRVHRSITGYGAVRTNPDRFHQPTSKQIRSRGRGRDWNKKPPEGFLHEPAALKGTELKKITGAFMQLSTIKRRHSKSSSQRTA